MKKIKIVLVCIVSVILFISGVLVAEWLEHGLVGYSTETEGVRAKISIDGNTAIKVNETITFNASRTGIGQLSLESAILLNKTHIIIIWDFDDGDGFQIDAEGVVVNHTYTEPGTYNVTLIVIRDDPTPPHKWLDIDRDEVIMTVVE